MVERGHSGTNRRRLQEGLIWGSMFGKTLLSGDEELGKKDDDHKFAPARRPIWSSWSHILRWRRRRIMVAVIALLLVYTFWNSAATSWELANDLNYPLESATNIKPAAPYKQRFNDDNDEPTGPPPKTVISTPANTKIHDYNGPIRFFRLGETLRKHNTPQKRNSNVLFAMSSLDSTSMLLPIICEMANEKRNRVHAVFMGRGDIPLQAMLEINGIDKVTCGAIWHDARPDYVEYSTDARAESATVGAMTHVYNFLHPQVAITDDLTFENSFFSREMQSETELREIPLIQIPRDKAEELTWIAKLDSGALKMWHKATVDILIRVPPDSSSVLRLLQSVAQADYSGLKPPHITLELPAHLDESVKQRLDDVQWPPSQAKSLRGSRLTIRRRITKQRATPDDSAIRFMELFYPASSRTSHVLVLAPEVQLSPQYFHFVMYTTLEYKHSSFSQVSNTDLMGISLEVPSVLLDGSKDMVLPTMGDMQTTRYKQFVSQTKSVPFLWQAPNSHATLFFGNKWAELHSFLSNRLAKRQQSPKGAPVPKLVSKKLPSWTEYALELMRVRGYSVLYPASTRNTFVTVHNEMYRDPEEFSPQAPRSKKPERYVMPRSIPLHLTLPFKGDLPALLHVPRLLYDGTMMDAEKIPSVAANLSATFRAEVGGCKVVKGKHKRVFDGDTSDLFCFSDDDDNEWVDEGNYDEDEDDEDDDDWTIEDIDEMDLSLDDLHGKAGGGKPAVSSSGVSATVEAKEEKDNKTMAKTEVAATSIAKGNGS